MIHLRSAGKAGSAGYPQKVIPARGANFRAKKRDALFEYLKTPERRMRIHREYNKTFGGRGSWRSV